MGEPDFWRVGNEVCRALGPEVYWSRNFGPKKIQKIQKILKIKIRSAQNVGKVWISRKKSSWPHLGPSGPIFCVGRKNQKNAKLLPIFLGGHPGMKYFREETLAVDQQTASANHLCQDYQGYGWIAARASNLPCKDPSSQNDSGLKRIFEFTK